MVHVLGSLPWVDNPDSNVHGANMGPTWGQQDPGGPYVGHMDLAIWEGFVAMICPMPIDALDGGITN